MMDRLIDIKSTAEELDYWFASTPPTDRILRLALTIQKWDHEDLSRLRLAERLSQEEIVELLGTAPPPGSCPVIYILVVCSQTSTLIALLDRVTSHQDLLSLVRLRYAGRNLLSLVSMRHNMLDMYSYLRFRLGTYKLYDLLCEKDEEGKTAIHWAVNNRSVSELLRFLRKDEPQTHTLFSIRDGQGRSALSYSIYRGCEESFQIIRKYYTGRQAELLKLAAITDNKGNTSFHYAAGQETSIFLIDLIESTCSPKTRKKLAAILSMRNVNGCQKVLGQVVDEINLGNEFIYDWAFDSLINNRYLLFDFPSVLIMYNTVHIDGADRGAASLETFFNDLGIQVKAKNSFTKKELFEAIKNHQGTKASRNGQIVALMSNGSGGTITDSNCLPISLKEIEHRMCLDSHRDTPKLLIAQCCQTQNSDASSDASFSTSLGDNAHNDQSYCPDNPDFCALMSTGPGLKSIRGLFIPFLANAIRDADVYTDITLIMKAVKRELSMTNLKQTPFCLDGLNFDFCIKNVLTIRSNSTARSISEVIEHEQQDPIPEYTKHSQDESVKRRIEELNRSKPGLHGAVGENSSVSSMPKDAMQAADSTVDSDSSENIEPSLLSSTDGKSRSKLSFSIYKGDERSFQSIKKPYTDKQKLLELASIPDEDGSNSYHYAAGQKSEKFLVDLLEATCSPNTRDELAEVLSKCNVNGNKYSLGYGVDEFNYENGLIYDWAIDSIKNNRYLLLENPSVVVFYTTANRKGAEKEAQEFIEILESVGLPVKPVKDFIESQLIEEIENSESSRDRNGQIIVLMSHGVLGAIKDNKGKEIQFKDIEELMRGPGDKPKVVIAQCCQSFTRQCYANGSTQTQLDDLEVTTSTGESTTFKPPDPVIPEETIDNTAVQEGQPNEDGHSGSKYQPYYPVNPQFSFIISCSMYKSCPRNRFIPALGETIKRLQPDQNMATLMKLVRRSVRAVSKGEQVPSLVDLLDHEFCIKNILPVYLAIKRKEREK